MLKRLTANDFEKYLDFAWALSQDLAHASFPVYTDGVKTKEDFLRTGRRGLEREDEEIFLFEQDGSVEGWLHCYYLREDKYIGIQNLLVRDGYAQALEELMACWRARFPGCSWHFYFPEENREALAFMKAHAHPDMGGEAVDVLLFSGYTPAPEDDRVIPIGPENFGLFRALHSPVEADMYWTSDRIAAAMDDWEIFAYMDGQTCRGVLYHNGKGQADLEIFGIDMPEPDAAVTEALLVSCLNKAKAGGAVSMYFFTDERTHKIAEKHGFRRVTTAHYFEGIL